jgi:hypothetical protein
MPDFEKKISLTVKGLELERNLTSKREVQGGLILDELSEFGVYYLPSFI